MEYLESKVLIGTAIEIFISLILLIWFCFKTLSTKALIILDIDVDDFVKWERNKVALRGEKHTSKVLCFPFFSILNAIGNPVVDYFSLDVEGSELPILQSIPWEKVKIKVKKN